MPIVVPINVKEAGVEYVVAKASSEIHGKVLRRVGADRVVFPENEAGCALASTLTQPGLLERFQLDTENSIVEILTPDEFHGQTLAQLDLRKRYGVNVLAIGDGEKFITNPSPGQMLKKGLVMVVIGSNTNLQSLPIH
jgi:trk system potassium uptake protein